MLQNKKIASSPSAPRNDEEARNDGLRHPSENGDLDPRLRGDDRGTRNDGGDCISGLGTTSKESSEQFTFPQSFLEFIYMYMLNTRFKAHWNWI